MMMNMKTITLIYTIVIICSVLGAIYIRNKKNYKYDFFKYFKDPKSYYCIGPTIIIGFFLYTDSMLHIESYFQIKFTETGLTYFFFVLAPILILPYLIFFLISCFTHEAAYLFLDGDIEDKKNKLLSPIFKDIQSISSKMDKTGGNLTGSSDDGNSSGSSDAGDSNYENSDLEQSSTESNKVLGKRKSDFSENTENTRTKRRRLDKPFSADELSKTDNASPALPSASNTVSRIVRNHISPFTYPTSRPVIPFQNNKGKEIAVRTQNNNSVARPQIGEKNVNPVQPVQPVQPVESVIPAQPSIVAQALGLKTGDSSWNFSRPPLTNNEGDSLVGWDPTLGHEPGKKASTPGKMKLKEVRDKNQFYLNMYDYYNHPSYKLQGAIKEIKLIKEALLLANYVTNYNDTLTLWKGHSTLNLTGEHQSVVARAYNRFKGDNDYCLRNTNSKINSIVNEPNMSYRYFDEYLLKQSEGVYKRVKLTKENHMEAKQVLSFYLWELETKLENSINDNSRLAVCKEIKSLTPEQNTWSKYLFKEIRPDINDCIFKEGSLSKDTYIDIISIEFLIFKFESVFIKKGIYTLAPPQEAEGISDPSLSGILCLSVDEKRIITDSIDEYKQEFNYCENNGLSSGEDLYLCFSKQDIELARDSLKDHAFNLRNELSINLAKDMAKFKKE